MAIAHISSTTVLNNTSSTSPHTVAFDSGSGETNRCLLVFIKSWVPDDIDISSVTYGGVAMTEVAACDNPTDREFWIFALAAPATGSNNIVITLASSARITAIASMFSGVNQTTPADVEGEKTQSTGTTHTISATTTKANTMLAGMMWNNDDANVFTLTVGDSAIFQLTAVANGVSRRLAGAVRAVAVAGGTSLAWTTAGSQETYGVLVALQPPGASTPANLKTWNTNPAANIKTINTNVKANVKTLDTNV